MRSFSPLLRASALLFALVAPAKAQGSFDPDDPRTRAQWNDLWFGTVDADYLAFKNQAAAAELLKWSGSFPLAAGRLRPLATGPAWTNLGPTKSTTNPYSDFNGDIDSGRPVSIVVDPTDRKTVYVATSGGGVWKSSNADTTSSADWTWAPITDTLPNSSATGNVSCGALAISPANHLTLYLALGDAFDAQGRGLYRSIDGGSTWTAATITDASKPTRSYQILAVDANTVYVGTNAGLLLSTDGGLHYAAVALPASGEAWSIQKLDAQHLACTVQDSGGVGHIFYTANGGTSWSAATFATAAGTTVGRITLASSPASATQAWGEYEDTTSGLIARGLLKTVDAGATWTWVAAPTSSTGLFQAENGDGDQGFYNHCIIVSPTNINDVFLGANLDFYRTTDGGASWTWMASWDTNGRAYSHADYHCGAWSPDGKLYIGNDGGVAIFLDPFRATPPTAHDATFLDGTRNKGLVTHLVYNLGSTQASNAADAKDRISLGMQDNGTRVRVPMTSGGALAGSSAFNESIGGDGFGTVWHSTDATKALGSLYYANIQRSTNGGSSFVDANNGITESGDSSNAPFQSHLALGKSSTPDVVYTHVNAKVYKSTDFGSSWSALPTTGLPSSYSIRTIIASTTSDAVAALLNAGRIYLYDPAASQWSGSTSDVTGGAQNVSAAWFNTEDPQIVYLGSVSGSSTVHHLFVSSHGGAWTPIDGSATTSNGLPFGIPVHVIQNLKGNAQMLFAGTDFGVYQSTNGGTSWVRFGSGLPLVAVRDLYLAPDGSYIRIATFGRGVWEASLLAPGVSVSPATANVNVSATAPFTATAANLAPDTVTWTATGGSLSPASTPGDGLTASTYTAPASISGVSQAFTITATGSDGSTKGTAQVTVIDPSLVTLSVSPSTPQAILPNKTLAFSATVNAGGVTWATSAGSMSAAAGSGSTLTAPAAFGTLHVTATSTAKPALSQSVAVHVANLDVNADSSIDVRDLLSMAAAYGTASAASDLNADGTVDDTDLAFFLANF